MNAAEATSQAGLPAKEALRSLRIELKQTKANEDWRGYLQAAMAQKALLNGSPLSRVEVARALIHRNDLAGAARELRSVIAMGQSLQILNTMPEFAALRILPAFSTELRESASKRVIANSSVVFSLQAALLPEDIDYDPQAKRFYVSSVLQQKIVAITLQGTMIDFAKSPDGWPILGLKIDHARQRLWASEVAFEGFAIVDKGEQGRSALLCFDLATGRLLRRIEGPRPSALGDLTLTPQGAVLASDGANGGIYRLRDLDSEIERIDNGDFISPQTVALTKDETRLIVPDYTRGIGVLNTVTRAVTWLDTANRYALNGIDGMYRVGNRLIAIQNGTNPERVVSFSLNRLGTRIVGEQVIERATKTLGDPTHGVVEGDHFFYIANSGWDAVGEDGKLKRGSTSSAPLVMKWRMQTAQP